MEPITVGIIVGVALFTGIASFFTAKEIFEPSSTDHAKEINNQLIIQKEQDNSHEFAQTIIISIMAIIMIVFAAYMCTKHMMYKWLQVQHNHRSQIAATAAAASAAAPASFEA